MLHIWGDNSLYNKQRKNTKNNNQNGDDDMAEERQNKVGKMNQGKKEEFQCKVNKGRSAVAIHQVGHALVRQLVGNAFSEEVITIARRNEQEYKPNTKKQLLNQIKVLLGAYVAEELFYGDDISVDVLSDIQSAIKYAEGIITASGMSNVISPITIKIMRTKSIGDERMYIFSGDFSKEVDNEIYSLLNEQLVITRRLLDGHKNEIATLAKFLFENETVTGEEFKAKYESINKKPRKIRCSPKEIKALKAHKIHVKKRGEFK